MGLTRKYIFIYIYILLKASEIDIYLYIRVNNHFSFPPLGRVNAENTSFTNLVHVLHQLLVDYQIMYSSCNNCVMHGVEL